LNLAKDFIAFVFPKTCVCCSTSLLEQEKSLCLYCRYQLPTTNFHYHNENTAKKVFYGRIPLVNITSLFVFHKKNMTQKLMHQLKYKGKEEISSVLGNWLAEDLKTVTWAKDIQMVIPVPLHRKKLKKRGYNQVAGFGKSISKHLGCDYSDKVLIKDNPSATQVFKNRSSRAEMKHDLFKLQNQNLIANKHILLVDDIITTGTTLETCSQILQQAPNVNISIATMAITL
jgi:competence protein ComFC